MRLDKFEPSSVEIMETMFNLSNLQKGEKHLDLGSGNGQFITEAIKRGADSIGYEIDKKLVEISEQKEKVVNKDCFEADILSADVITCWFSLLPETQLLMNKLHKEMKQGARLVKQAYTEHEWKPLEIKRVDGNLICLYIK